MAQHADLQRDFSMVRQRLLTATVKSCDASAGSPEGVRLEHHPSANRGSAFTWL